MYRCVCLHMSAGSSRGQGRLIPPEMGTKGAGTKTQSFQKSMSALNL